MKNYLNIFCIIAKALMMNWTLEVRDVACPVDDMKTTDCSCFFLGFFSFREDGRAERMQNMILDVESTNW